MATLESPATHLHTAPFSNESATDFTQEHTARKMRAALDRVGNQLGREYDLIIGGQRVKTGEKIKSINPAQPSQVVGLHQKAGMEQVEPAIQAALRAFESWSRTSAEERAGLLFRVADLLRQRKFEFCAWLVFEVSKNWAEADADIAETIDFCEFYAREALRLAKATSPIQLPGERDSLFYIPLGVGAIIPPWNFACAIMAGMTAASIVCGNTVILKPSSDSPTIAAKFVELLEEAGMPDGVVNFCPGSGATFGNALVAHPKTRYIAFTGSREVGLDINRRAAEAAPGQIWIKRSILEMGGKDGILVDADADLDAAVEGVTASAFGFQGQKCSACSRAIVDERIYEPFLAQLKARVEKLTVGDPAGNASLGAVINQASMNSILGYIEYGKKDGRLDFGRRPRSRGRLFHSANRDRRPSAKIKTRTGRDFWPGLGRDQVEQFRPCAGNRQRYRVWSYGRGLHKLQGKDGPGGARLPRRQSLLQSQVYRGHGWRASFRRIQYVRYRLQSRRTGVFVLIHAGQIGGRKIVLTTEDTGS